MPILELLSRVQAPFSLGDDLLDHKPGFEGRRLLFLDIPVDVGRGMDQWDRAVVENLLDMAVLEGG